MLSRWSLLCQIVGRAPFIVMPHTILVHLVLHLHQILGAIQLGCRLICHVGLDSADTMTAWWYIQPSALQLQIIAKGSFPSWRQTHLPTV